MAAWPGQGEVMSLHAETCILAKMYVMHLIINLRGGGGGGGGLQLP